MCVAVVAPDRESAASTSRLPFFGISPWLIETIDESVWSAIPTEKRNYTNALGAPSWRWPDEPYEDIGFPD
ncbi:hypothetical protein CL634_09075 [bacterium]|nr:hypothetical protein [bacterium]|tara:strand:+ start:3277 stop:3489 length:213 start_codon:yes stop_codon:yes gene_type:complete